jgi:adenylate kinase
MKTTHALKRIGALVVAGGLMVAFAGPALADSPTSTTTPAPTASTTSHIDQLKAKCETAIQNRLTSITEATTDVNGAAHLTAGDKATLLEQIGDEQTGLSALGVKIAGDTDLATLRTDCKNIVAEYHWYIIGLPKVHLTIAADASVALVQTLDDLSTRLQADINRAQQRGKDVTQAQADENALNAAISSALGAASPVPAMVLPLAFNNWTAAQPVLQSARTDLGNARTDFTNARSDAKKVIADLKALYPAPTPTVTATATAS